MARGKSEFRLQCEAAGLNPPTVRARMKNGMSLKEALSMPSLVRRPGQKIGYDPNIGMLAQADDSWKAVRECIRKLDSQLKLRDRIISRIKEDTEGRKAYERVMKEIVEDSPILGGGR